MAPRRAPAPRRARPPVGRSPKYPPGTSRLGAMGDLRGVVVAALRQGDQRAPNRPWRICMLLRGASTSMRRSWRRRRSRRGQILETASPRPRFPSALSARACLRGGRRLRAALVPRQNRRRPPAPARVGATARRTAGGTSPRAARRPRRRVLRARAPSRQAPATPSAHPSIFTGGRGAGPTARWPRRVSPRATAGEQQDAQRHEQLHELAVLFARAGVLSSSVRRPRQPRKSTKAVAHVAEAEHRLQRVARLRFWSMRSGVAVGRQGEEHQELDGVQESASWSAVWCVGSRRPSSPARSTRAALPRGDLDASRRRNRSNRSVSVW